MNKANSGLTRRRFLKHSITSCSACAFSMFEGGITVGTEKPADIIVKEAGYYDKLPERKVKCRLCPHECQVADLERGTCGVRENRKGKYYTLVHSNPCSAHIDPVEKKPLYHYYPGSSSFSIATAGCNFVCKFCQNWEISQKRPEQVKSFRLTPGGVIDVARRRRCKTVAHTYTEPVIFYEYMLDCAREGQMKGIPNIMISNGYINEKPMRKLCKYLGAVKIDLKSFTDKFYRDFCAGTLHPVLDTLKVLKDEGVWFEIVVLIIPTLNDSSQEINEMTRWIVKALGSDVPLHFSRYYPTFMLKNIPPTPPRLLFRCREIAQKNGIKFVYIGNIMSDASHTYCPGCKKILIRRTGYTCSTVGMKGNKCKYCNEIIPGIF